MALLLMTILSNEGSSPLRIHIHSYPYRFKSGSLGAGNFLNEMVLASFSLPLHGSPHTALMFPLLWTFPVQQIQHNYLDSDIHRSASSPKYFNIQSQPERQQYRRCWASAKQSTPTALSHPVQPREFAAYSHTTCKHCSCN